MREDMILSKIASIDRIKPESFLLTVEMAGHIFNVSRDKFKEIWRAIILHGWVPGTHCQV